MPAPKGGSYSLKSLYSTKKIEIPEYQRPYDWKKKHLDQLLASLDDHIIEQHANIQSNPYFLGNLMVHSDPGKDDWYLVDGQQRLVTLTILAAAIRDLSIENGLFGEAFEIQHEVIMKEDQKRYLTPRDTKKKGSPKSLLMPLQVPSDMKMEFKFSEEYGSSGDAEEVFKLSEEIEIRFPLKQGDEEEIYPGTKFIFGQSYSPGDKRSQLYGRLEIASGSNIGTEEILAIEKNFRDEEIHKVGGWPQTYAIPRHYKQCMKHISDGLLDDPVKDASHLKHWKNVVTYMAFTTTTFTEAEDAIFYFGKLNDADTSMQLNVGDLMRQHSHWITEQDPKNDENNEGIKSEWQKVESALKDDTPSKKDQVPDFLGHWLTSRGSKVTAKKVFTELKEELENYKKSANEYDKSEVLTWFKEIEVCSELYKQIVEAEDGEDHCLIMRGIDGVGKQHRALFLSGMRVFQKNGMKNEMIRLIKIFEYMTLKGVLIPSAMEIDGIPSNEIYGWINDWCTEIDKKSKSYKAKITTPIAKDLLNEMAVKVKNKCDSVWSAAAASDGIKWDAESMKKLVVSQNQARLILTRIEMSKSGTKVWTRDMEVEHVLPQKWNKDWSNKRKGGDFKESTYKDYVNYLGNRSLLDPGSNKKLSNRGFREKQNVVDHGYDAQAKNWKITEDLSSKKKKLWNPKEIESRTKNLAEKMIGIYNDSFLGL